VLKFQPKSDNFQKAVNLESDASICTWKLYKTLNSQGIGISQAETQQLEELTALYQKAIKQILYKVYLVLPTIHLTDLSMKSIYSVKYSCGISGFFRL
jgi:ABC-type oligopeptide transport system substrate-binding subunit